MLKLLAINARFLPNGRNTPGKVPILSYQAVTFHEKHDILGSKVLSRLPRAMQGGGALRRPLLSFQC